MFSDMLMKKKHKKKNMITKMMTEESPAKVMGLLGVSLFSLAFLFAVSMTNASFSGTPVALPDFGPQGVVAMISSDPMGPQHVMPVVDEVASAYSNFVHQNLTGPVQESVAFAQANFTFRDDFAWVIDNSDYAIVDMTGLQGLVPNLPSPQAHPAPGSVAGAFTMRFTQ